MIKRINAAILRAGDNVSASLLLIIIAYAGIELLNFSAIAEFIESAGYGKVGGYVGATVFSILLFALFWLLIAYRSKGYHTGLLWVSLIASVLAIAALNYYHAENAAGVVLAVIFAVVSLLAGLVSKTTIGNQLAELDAAQTLQKLRDDLSRLRAETVQASVELDATRETISREKTALARQKTAVEADIEQLQVTLRQLKDDIAQAELEQQQPGEEWRQALQLDALIAAGRTQIEAARWVGVSVSTARRRLELVNGSGLRQEAA